MEKRAAKRKKKSEDGSWLNSFTEFNFQERNRPKKERNRIGERLNY